MPDFRGDKKACQRVIIALAFAPFLFMFFLLAREISFFFKATKPLVSHYGPPLSVDPIRMKSFGWTVEGDWIFDGRSIALLPGRKGTLILALRKDKRTLPVFRLYPNLVKDSKVSLFASLDGDAPKKVSLNGRLFKIKGEKRETISRIELTGETPESDSPFVLLRDLEFFQYSPAAMRLSRSMGALVIAFLFYLFILGFILGKIKLVKRNSALIFFLILLFTSIGFYLRWTHLIERVGHPLDPDARGYLDIALQNKGLFHATTDAPPYIREPFFIWFIRSAFLIFRDESESALRFLTVLLSIVVIPATFLVGKRWFGAFPAVLASAFCAINPYFIDMSARGLRMELFILCVLAFLFSIERLGDKDPWTSVRCGLSAGVCALTQLTSLSFTIPLILFFAIRRKVRLSAVIFPFVIIINMILPHLIFNYQEKGDPLFSSNIHARFYRNMEFAGEPGYMTAEQVKADPYGGEPVTTFEYIFGLRSPTQVIARTIKGLFRIFFGGYVRGGLLGGRKILFLIYAFGFFKTLFSRKWEWVCVAVILEAPVAFIASMGVDWRLALHASPLLYLFMANGIFFIFSKSGVMKQNITFAGGG